MQRSPPPWNVVYWPQQTVTRFNSLLLCFHERASQPARLFAGEHPFIQLKPSIVQFPVSEVQSRMMMTSAPTLCVSSSRIPSQPGLCIHSPVSLVSPSRSRAGLNWSSGFPRAEVTAPSPGSQHRRRRSFVSRAEFEADASGDEEVLAKLSAGVRNLPGTKIVELVEPISPTKLPFTIDNQLPPLLSMVIDGFPPLRQSKYVHEAEKLLHQSAKRYPNVVSWDSYCRLSLCTASYGHPRVISLDRLIAISKNYALMFVLDDLFFDTPNELLQREYGVSLNACGSPQKIQEYLKYLDAIYNQQVQPHNPTPIETLMWEIGQDTLELSNLEWFNNYVASVVEHHHSNVASEAAIVQGHNKCFQDLESYTVMRAGNIGGRLIQMMVEFAKDTYIPSVLRANPYLDAVTTTTSIHIGFVNDIFSYHKESSLEQNPRNLISVLMECEGKPFVQTIHRAISLVNTYGHAIIDFEAKAWNSTLRSHLHDIKELIAGSVYYSTMEKRYRHPDSVFLELRDMNNSWKILHVEGP